MDGEDVCDADDVVDNVAVGGVVASN